MSHLTDETREASIRRLREAAVLLERGEEVEAGKLILAGLKPVATDLRKTYGPMVKLIVGSWVRATFEEPPA